MAQAPTTDRPTYDVLVSEATDRLVAAASEYLSRGWPVAEAVKEADNDALFDFHADHDPDLFVAFDEYRTATAEYGDADQWPPVDRNELVSTIAEWTQNGPNPAHSAALATAEAMVRADARAIATDRLTAAHDGEMNLNLYRFKDALERSEMAFGYDGVMALAIPARGTAYNIRIYRLTEGHCLRKGTRTSATSPGELQNDLWQYVMDEIERREAEAE